MCLILKRAIAVAILASFPPLALAQNPGTPVAPPPPPIIYSIDPLSGPPGGTLRSPISIVGVESRKL